MSVNKGKKNENNLLENNKAKLYITYTVEVICFFRKQLQDQSD